MSLTERERLILHMTQLATQKTFGKLTKSLPYSINVVVKNRCRQLDQTEIDEVFKDVEEELMSASTVYEENNI